MCATAMPSNCLKGEKMFYSRDKYKQVNVSIIISQRAFMRHHVLKIINITPCKCLMLCIISVTGEAV